MVYRIYVAKKAEFANEASALKNEIKNLLKIDGIESLSVINRYDCEDIEKEFFGCGGVAKIDDLQNKLIKLARGGFKHHTTVANGHVKAILEEAFKYYLGYDVVEI